MTNFVFGILIGIFILAALVVAALVELESLYEESGALAAPLALIRLR
ncbi:MAG TPA: hypothetical protein VFU11_09725 [Solirubrobacterales bacterium]|nr:hypothetical protein [Solirubrobacterales bacterium]